jgi:hypothetical protein
MFAGQGGHASLLGYSLRQFAKAILIFWVRKMKFLARMRIKTLFAGGVLAPAMIGVAAAGPFDDAVAQKAVIGLTSATPEQAGIRVPRSLGLQAHGRSLSI